MANSAADGRIVKLVSSDNDEYEVPVDVASMSELVKNVLEDHDAEGVQCVELSRVNSTVLKKVIDFMTHHKEDPMVLLPKPSYSPFRRNLKDEVQVWYCDFMANDPTCVFELVDAANYMGIAQLVDLCCCIVVMGETGSVEKFREYAFSFCCEKLTRIELPESVKHIGAYAFSGCSALESVTFPTGDGGGSLKTIDSYAFRGCEKLTRIEIPGSVQCIGQHAFRECSALESVTIPGSVESIQGKAFFECSALESVTFATGDGGGSLKTINDSAFCECRNLASIEIPASVESIGFSAFDVCSALKSVTFATGDGGGSLKTIHGFAFKGCEKLTSIEIPASVENIGEYAFSGCSVLESVTFPSGDGGGSLKTIPDYAFFRCKNLTSIEIPSSVERIGEYAFRECSAF